MYSLNAKQFINFKFLAPYKKKHKDISEKLMIGPKKGSSVLGFLDRQTNLTSLEAENVLESSKDILSKCVNPNITSSFSNTGLVIGKVQSGKTLSFTSLIALARDNGFKVVIVIAGRTNLLLKQTIDRLREDLENHDDYITISGSQISQDRNYETANRLNKHLKQSGENSRLLVIPVLKHQSRVRDLRMLFEMEEINSLVQKNAVLIIDDEADQASLNTEAKMNSILGLDNESANFAAIKQLRQSLPIHTFIQYTATPQGPLLIDQFCLLSPDWHTLLIPGSNYTGGNEFFDNTKDIVRSIPVENDTYPFEVQSIESIPESLKDCLIEFYILTILMGDKIIGKKVFNKRSSMLIHPTFKVNAGKTGDVTIRKFYDWVEKYNGSLIQDIQHGDIDRFYRIYLETKTYFSDLNTFQIFPSFDEVMAPMENLIDWEVKVHCVIGGYIPSGEEFPWKSHKHHILVGGALLDRGFTVKDLIVTYMPRDTKGRNQSDTIEQRCRFYGYRKSYLDFCRVYITSTMLSDYETYNQFENDLHNYLSQHTLEEFFDKGSLMLMGSNLRVTNLQRVAGDVYSQTIEKHTHFQPQSMRLNLKNNHVIESFLGSYRNQLKPFYSTLIGSDNEIFNHNITRINLNEMFDLFESLEFFSQKDIILQRTLLKLLDTAMEFYDSFWLIEISPNKKTPRERTVRRTNVSLDDQNPIYIYKIPQLMAGDIRKVNMPEHFGDRSLLLKTQAYHNIPIDYQQEPILQIHRIKAVLQTEMDCELYNQDILIPCFYCPPELEQNYIHKISPFTE